MQNKALIKSLEEIKTKATVVSSSLDESVQLAATLDAERNVYRPIAASGSALFFLLRDMRVVNHMYAFSLAIFLELFARALQAGASGTDVVRCALLFLRASMCLSCFTMRIIVISSSFLL